MKTHPRGFITALLIMCTVLSGIEVSALTKTSTVQFQTNLVEHTTLTHNNVIYDVISYPDMYSIDTIGTPSLPYKMITFDVPTYATNLRVSCTRLGVQNIPLQGVVHPNQTPVPTSIGDNPDFSEPNPAIYGSTLNFPTSQAHITHDGFFKGRTRRVSVAVCPFVYNPSNATLKLYNRITVNLSYDLGDASTVSLPFKPIDYANQSAASTLLAGDGINGGLVPGGPFAPPGGDTASVALPVYTYTIITSSALAPAYKRLVALRQMKGIDAGIVTMSTILGHPDCALGDTISFINDDAGKLRAYLRHIIHNTPDSAYRFVLLGGDAAHVPVRYGYGTHGETLIKPSRVPTDWYFAELNSVWNEVTPNVYGSIHDRLDWEPDIFVGRLPASSQEQVNDYIDKLEYYELNPGNGDMSYLNDTYALFGYGSYDGISNEPAIIQNGMEQLSSNGHYNQFFTNKMSSLRGAEFVSDLNQHHSGYVTLHSHGSPEGIHLSQENITYPFNAHGLSCLDEYRKYFDEEANNGLDNLTESYTKPNIIYATSCNVVPYDNVYELDSDGFFTPRLNFGESAVLGKNYGGVAFLGNTREGYFRYSAQMEDSFLNNIIASHTNDNNKIYSGNLGIAECSSKLKNITTKTEHHINLAHNLIGDPMINMWLGEPSTISGLTIQYSNNDAILSGAELDGKTISVISLPLGTTSYNVSKYQASGTTINIPNGKKSIITIADKNNLPYICPLIFDNGNLRQSHHYYVSSMQLGTGTNYARLYQNTSNSFTALGTVYLGNMFAMQTNANMDIDAHDTVTIDNMLFQANNTLNINAPNVVINGLTIPDDCTVTINGVQQ